MTKEEIGRIGKETCYRIVTSSVEEISNIFGEILIDTAEEYKDRSREEFAEAMSIVVAGAQATVSTCFNQSMEQILIEVLKDRLSLLFNGEE